MGWQKHALAHGEAATREDLIGCDVRDLSKRSATRPNCVFALFVKIVGEWFTGNRREGRRAGAKTFGVSSGGASACRDHLRERRDGDDAVVF